MNENKIIALTVWNITLLFIGLVGHFSKLEFGIEFAGAWFGVLFWEGLEIRKWLFS